MANYFGHGNSNLHFSGIYGVHRIWFLLVTIVCNTCSKNSHEVPIYTPMAPLWSFFFYKKSKKIDKYDKLF